MIEFILLLIYLNNIQGQNNCCPGGTPLGYFNPFIEQSGTGIGCSLAYPGFYAQDNCKGQLLCPLGYYCPNAGLYSPILCDAGKYCPSQGLTAGIACPGGFYCQSGSFNPTICPIGSYCPAQAPTFIPCPKGYYCPFSGIVTPPICPMGYYCPQGLSAPIKCPKGTYNSNTGSTSLLNCSICISELFPGYTCDDEGLIYPEPCKAGKYCPPSNISLMIDCPAGTYNPNNGSVLVSSCKICPEGTYCPNTGTITPLICPMGYYCKINSINPIFCPVGTYNNQTGSTSIKNCNLCPTGYFTSEQGQININSCIQCPIGTYCLEGSSSPATCPSNYYCPDSKQKIPCPMGTYYNGLFAFSVSQCIKCEPGFFCSGNGAAALECDMGTFSANSGSSNCLPCPEGYYCVSGSSTPIKCPVNTMASKGAGGCTPCPNGQFTKVPGASACFECPSSKFSIEGWWCMTLYEKLIFAGIWVGSLISVGVSFYKIKKYIKKRIKKMKESGINFTLYRFLFLEKTIRRRATILTILGSENDKSPILEENKNEIQELREIILQLRKDVEELKNK